MSNATIVSAFRTFAKGAPAKVREELLAAYKVKGEAWDILIVDLRAAYLAEVKGYKADAARANVDGTLANPKAKGDGAKRTDAQQTDYDTAIKTVNRFLAHNEIVTVARRKPGAGKGKGAKAPDAPVVPTAVTVDRASDMSGVDIQFGLIAEIARKTQAASAKAMVGDKGAAYRDLATLIQKEVARIAAMAN